MKKNIFYFDPTVKKIFAEKVKDDGEKVLELTSHHNFVSGAEIVARIIEIDDEEQIPTRLDPGYKFYKITNFVSLKVDQGIYYDQEVRAYKAADYGFVIYNNGKLRLLPALSITRDRLKAYYFIHPTKFGKIPTVSEIQEYLHSMQILAGIGEAKIGEQLEKINTGEQKVSKLLVAQGKAPVHGHPEYYIPTISIEKKAGEILSDGSIDFKEVGSIIQITKHQEILKRIPGVKALSGYDIYGDKVPAETREAEGYKKGVNIVQSGADENIFCAEIDGCIVVENNKVSVLPIAVINGDVNYDTGNIDFNGSVHINGSVITGFSVKAKGDVIVEKSVEDATIEADGDITVKEGVVGKEYVKLIAGGNLTAKYLLNANVEAAGEIVVADSIINCTVFSNDRVSVIDKSGKIIGGSVTALHDIIVKVSGAPNETETTLKVGRNLFIERELKELRKEIGTLKEDVAETMRLLKVNFGEGVFEDPKKYISILPDIKKKKCLELLKELGNKNKDLKELIAKTQEVQEGLKLDREPVIIITNKVYPGTVLNIKKSVRKLDKPATNAKFYEDPEEKAIRFTAAT